MQLPKPPLAKKQIELSNMATEKTQDFSNEALLKLADEILM